MTTLTINDKIEHEIAKIEAIAADLPGIVVIHSVKDQSVVWMCERGLAELGLTLQEVKELSTAEYYNTYFNPEDAKDYVPKIMGLVANSDPDETVTFFQQVKFKRLPHWMWHLASSKIFMVDEAGEPLLCITIALPIDGMHHMSSKADRLLQENNFLRKNLHNYRKLSPREIDILRALALGKTSADTAEELFIAQHTVETHRKNIRRKLGTSSYFDLCQYARAFDLI